MSDIDDYIIQGITEESHLRNTYDNFEKQKNKSQKYIDRGVSAYIFLVKVGRVFPHIRSKKNIYYQVAFFHSIGGVNHLKTRDRYADLKNILQNGFVFKNMSLSIKWFSPNVTLSTSVATTNWRPVAVLNNQDEEHKGTEFGVLLKSGKKNSWLSFRSSLPVKDYDFAIKSTPKEDIVPVVFLPMDAKPDTMKQLISKYTSELKEFSKQIEFF